MISITNEGGDLSGWCTYAIRVNDVVIKVFEHHRGDLIDELLKRAYESF